MQICSVNLKSFLFISSLQVILLVLVALVACAMAQWPYNGYYYNTHAAAAYPYGYNYYGAYNPALNYYWKKTTTNGY
ncbi:UNVERIFIED_CONTAM: hypothetical protein NCL1_26273 [Trichonephila clavipes]